MEGDAISVAESVRKIVSSRPFLTYYLCMDVINYSALARKLKDCVSRVLKKDVKVDTIKIALIRFKSDICKKIKKDFVEEACNELEKSSIDFAPNIVIVTIRKEAFVLNADAIVRLSLKSRFFRSVERLHEYLAIVSKENLPDLVSIVGKEYIEEILPEQTAAIVRLSEVSKPHYVLQLIIDLMVMNGIRIGCILFDHKELVITVPTDEEHRVQELFETLRLLRSASENRAFAAH